MHFGLDEYTYNLLVEYFKTRREIKNVKIFGSRVNGTARKSSDLDLLVDGTFKPETLIVYTDEINKLRHPYRIDLIDVNDRANEKFVGINYYCSECLYNIHDYFPNERFFEKNSIVKIEDSRPRWQRRYESRFKIKYDSFMEKLNIYEQSLPESNMIDFQIEMFVAFKAVYEGCWKMAKDYLKDLGTVIFFPRDVLKQCYKLGIIKNLNIWYEMIYDINIMTDEMFVDVRDELFYRLKENYLPEIFNVQKYFTEKYPEGENL